MSNADIKKAVEAKFKEQQQAVNLPNVCPHCGKKIDFEFEHTQNTTVSTKLVKITKGK